MAELENKRHERFALELSKGLSQRKAYRAAFPNSEKWKDETVDSKASALAKNDKVSARLKELADEASKADVKSAQERREWLSEVMDSSREKMSDRLKACDMLNKMDGEYITRIEGEMSVKKLEDVL